MLVQVLSQQVEVLQLAPLQALLQIVSTTTSVHQQLLVIHANQITPLPPQL